MVVIDGTNLDEVFDFIEFVKDKKACVRFIEFMPVGKGWENSTPCVPTARLMEMIGEHHQLEALKEDGARNVAREFSIPGYEGSVGFITSVSEHYCGSCNRMRVTADGQLKTCLHYPAELSLRDALRSYENDEDLKELIIGTLFHKREGRPANPLVDQEVAQFMESRSMYEIGG